MWHDSLSISMNVDSLSFSQPFWGMDWYSMVWYGLGSDGMGLSFVLCSGAGLNLVLVLFHFFMLFRPFVSQLLSVFWVVLCVGLS